jgi:hypothetical protein
MELVSLIPEEETECGECTKAEENGADSEPHDRGELGSACDA